MPRGGTPHNEAIRAAAIAALLAGESVSAVSRSTGVSRPTLRQWRQGSGLGDLPAVAQEKRSEIGGLVADLLAATLRTLRAQADTFNDPAWLKQYSPADAAILFGVLADKGLRLLEAQAADDADADGPSP